MSEERFGEFSADDAFRVISGGRGMSAPDIEFADEEDAEKLNDMLVDSIKMCGEHGWVTTAVPPSSPTEDWTYVLMGLVHPMVERGDGTIGAPDDAEELPIAMLLSKETFEGIAAQIVQTVQNRERLGGGGGGDN